MAYSSKNSLGAGIPRKYPMDTPWSFALIFALPLLAMLLIYYSRGYLKRIPLLLVNIKAAHKEYREGQQNLNRTLSLLAWFSLVPATFLIIYLLRNYASSLEHNVGLSAIPIVVGIILAYIALKHSVLYIASVLTFSKEFTRELLYNGGLFVGAWGFISFFFVLLLFIYDGKQLDILLYIVALLCILFILLYLVRTLQLFLTEKISLFFWILYLCTLEISPVLLVINYLYPTK